MRTPVFLLALALGLAVRVAALPLPGTEDVGSWKIWAFAASEDVTAMYGVGGSPPTRGVVHWRDRQTTVDYPPMALYALGAIGSAYRLWDPGFADTRALLIFLKLPGLVCGAAIAALLWLTVSRSAAVDQAGQRDAGRWAALAYWLNPAVILNSEALGYLDPWMMLPALLALLLVHAEAPLLAGACAAIAALTKPQGVLIAPGVVMAVLAIGGPRALLRATTGALVTATVLLVPFYLRDALPNMWLAFGAFYSRRDVVSAYACNAWWIVNWGLRAWFLYPQAGLPQALFVTPRILSITRLREIGFPNPRPYATGLVALVVAWACWRMRGSRALAHHAALVAFTVHAYFVLSVGVHEHHMMLAVPFLALAAALAPWYRPLFWAVSGIVALNLNLFYGISRGYGWAFPRALTRIDASVLLAGVNVVALIWFAAALADDTRRLRRRDYTREYVAVSSRR